MTIENKIDLDTELDAALNLNPLATILGGFTHSLGAYMSMIQDSNQDDKSKVTAIMFTAAFLSQLAQGFYKSAQNMPAYDEINKAIEASRVATEVTQ